MCHWTHCKLRGCTVEVHIFSAVLISDLYLNTYLFKKKLEDIEIGILSIQIIYFMITISYCLWQIIVHSLKLIHYPRLDIIAKRMWWNLKRQNWHTLWIFYAGFSSRPIMHFFKVKCWRIRKFNILFINS